MAKEFNLSKKFKEVHNFLIENKIPLNLRIKVMTMILNNEKEFIEVIEQDFKDCMAFATPTKQTNRAINQFLIQIKKRAGPKLT